MAKTRISISLEPGDAELIRAVAAQHGLDVSAFLVAAGRKEAFRLARLAESFAEIDAAIAEAEAEAEELDWPPNGDAEPDEVARVQAEIAAARAESAARRRGAVA
ncbi:hypothetical protein AB0H77_33600 [Streptomyces sp. NPDC050844]|uniref:hypothetical protein n=1 Tax=Streptomyces sp. NPDC050844 TaxID=3155790 RepID=UPI00340AF9BD